MGLLSDTDLDALDTQVVASVYQGADTADIWMPMLAEEVVSITGEVTYAHLVNPTKPRRWKKGTSKVFQSIQRGSRKVANDRFELTVNADRDALADDITGLFRKELVDTAFENGQKFAWIKDELAAAVILNNMTCMDKGPLFSTTHRRNPLDASSPTYANTFTGMPFNDDNVARALGIVMGIKGPDDMPLKLKVSHCLVAPAKAVMAKRIFGASQINGTDNPNKGVAMPLVIPEFVDDPETWYLAVLNGRKRPIQYQTREPLKPVALFDPRDPNVWQRNELVWTSSERFAIAGGYPYTIYRFKP